ncbi:MAG: DUF2946 family protein [Paracoccaceae bacterium]
MPSLRSLLLLLIAVALSLGGPGMRMAGASGGQTIVICSPDGARSVQIGPDGKPVQTRGHDCRSCCLALAGDLPARLALPLRAASAVSRAWRETPLPVPASYRSVPEARAPPAAV